MLSSTRRATKKLIEEWFKEELSNNFFDEEVLRSSAKTVTIEIGRAIIAQKDKQPALILYTTPEDLLPKIDLKPFDIVKIIPDHPDYASIVALLPPYSGVLVEPGELGKPPVLLRSNWIESMPSNVFLHFSPKSEKDKNKDRLHFENIFITFFNNKIFFVPHSIDDTMIALFTDVIDRLKKYGHQDPFNLFFSRYFLLPSKANRLNALLKLMDKTTMSPCITIPRCHKAALTNEFFCNTLRKLYRHNFKFLYVIYEQKDVDFLRELRKVYSLFTKDDERLEVICGASTEEGVKAFFEFKTT